MTDATATTEPKRWGFTDEELAQLETVYRPGLLDGKSFIVSGGGTGMGKVMVFLLARLGAKVSICARREENLKATADAVKRLVGADIHYKSMSIREPEQVEAYMDEVFTHFGGLTTLVNNAGGQYPQAAIDFSDKGWNAVIDLNVNGTWYMMQRAARRWRDRGEPGNIVTITAPIDRGLPQIAHTCAARGAVTSLSRTVAVEWAPLNIRVNCLAPGSIATDGLNTYPPEANSRFKNANPMRRLGDAWDIAQGIVYLSSESGKFITGQTLTVDGGYTMWGNVWPGGVPDYFNVI